MDGCLNGSAMAMLSDLGDLGAHCALAEAKLGD